jgi:myosin heavy subunit
MEHIDKFISKVRRRLNQHLCLTIMIESLVLGGIVITGIGLSYILRGCHIPLFWYPACLIASLFFGCCLWFYLRNSRDQAAKFTDKHFKLKDSVRSYSGFHKAGRSSGFYELQAEQTENYISSISINKIRYKWPTYLILLAAVLILSSVLMGFKQDSPLVRQKIAQKKFALDTTESINQQVNEIMEQIQKEIEDKNLESIVDINEVRAMIERLEETADIKDAMRQYAQLEKELGEVLSKLTQRQDEQLLERMGKQLQKDDTTKALGNQLTQKDFQAAAQEMQEFKIDPKNTVEMQKEQIEKLKTMAARMAEEASRSQSGTGQQSLNGQNQSGQQNNQNQQGRQSSANRLSQMAQQLNQSAQQLSQMMQNSQSQNSQQSSEEMQQMAQNANQNLNNIGSFLQQMDAKRQAQSMMQGMLNSLAQCQGGLCNMPGQNNSGQMPADSPNPGGRDAGTGTSNARNTEPGKDAPSGQITQLQGTQGAGPSVTSAEQSGSGSGSTAGTLELEHEEYMQQVESFIRREDVPETVKSGVKAYFENIHNVNEGN